MVDPLEILELEGDTGQGDTGQLELEGDTGQGGLYCSVLFHNLCTDHECIYYVKMYSAVQL